VHGQPELLDVPELDELLDEAPPVPPVPLELLLDELLLDELLLDELLPAEVVLLGELEHPASESGPASASVVMAIERDRRAVIPPGCQRETPRPIMETP
jgi:hypothetical protein